MQYLNLIVVEFSLAQTAFHKETIGEMLRKNSMNLLHRIQTDYLPIAIFTTNTDADKFIDECYEEMKNYSMYKSITGETIVK